MNKGYIPEGNTTSDNTLPPNVGSSIMNEEKKSFGAIIDELLNNPEVMMVQAGRVINEAKKAEEKILNKNKELEKQLIEKDKEIAYLKGKIDVMKDFINELKNTDIEYGSIETQLLEKN